MLRKSFRTKQKITIISQPFQNIAHRLVHGNMAVKNKLQLQIIEDPYVISKFKIWKLFIKLLWIFVALFITTFFTTGKRWFYMSVTQSILMPCNCVSFFFLFLWVIQFSVRFLHKFIRYFESILVLLHGSGSYSE